MRWQTLAVVWLVLACAAAAQDLAPEVLLLARIKAHLADELAHLPNYTCLETLARFHREARPHARLQPLDTVRLEIVYSDRREWYGSPGDRTLNSDTPVEFIGSGMIGNGAFGMTLRNILAGARITWRGPEPAGGRDAIRYDFHLPAFLKTLTISLPSARGAVGEEGSFWVDPQSLDLVRLEAHATEIPVFLPLAEAGTAVNYARMRIGEYDVLLAQDAELHLQEDSGAEGYDRLDFTHCRAYAAHSAIRFDAAPGSDPPVTAAPPVVPAEAVPALLAITVRLATPVTDLDAVGTLIEGKVAGAVRHKGKIVIADGSLVRGRIRRLERFRGELREFVVGLEFTEVETSAGPLRFYADLLRVDRYPGIRPSLSEQVRVPGGFGNGTAVVTLPELPGVAAFFVSGAKFTIPSGFGMVWRTRGLVR